MTFSRLANSLVFRMVVFGIFMILTAGVVRIVILSVTIRDSIQDLVTAQLLSQATYVAGDINQKVLVRKQFLESLAKQLPPSLIEQPQQLENWLAQRYTLAPRFSLGIGVIRENGKGAIADFPSLEGMRQLDFSAIDWFRTAHDSGTFIIGKPTLDPASHQAIIIMAAPINDAQGRVIAVIYGDTALDDPGFLSLIQKNSIGQTGGFLLVSPRDRIFVAATMPQMRLQPTPPPGVNLMHDRGMAGWRGTGITVNAFGIEELEAMVSVPVADWFVVARMPTAEAFQPVTKARHYIVQYTIIFALAMIIILVLFLGHMLRPLKESSRQMRNMADGQIPLAPLPVVRQDEVGEMVDCFNRLVETIRTNDARMIELAHHDALTGLPNRLSFLMRVEQTVALTLRQQGALALMFIDLDDFKPINDRYGHKVGDQLLQQVSTPLGCERASGRFGRPFWR